MYEPGNKIGPSRGDDPIQFGDADLDRLLAELRVPEEVYPAPGFYAKVMERIDSQKGRSIWSVFLEPWFGRRLAVASAALMLLLGAALFVPASEVEDGLMAQGDTTVVTGRALSADSLSVDGSDQDKNAVLVNLVTYQEH